MRALAWLVSLLLLAALAHVRSSRSKRGARQQLLDAVCAAALRSAQLAFAIHCSFQAWVQNSLTQAGLDVQELLQAADTDAVLDKRQQLADFLASLPQRPEHLAVILPEAELRLREPPAGLLPDDVDNAEALCAWSILAGVPRLSIYTRDGSLERALESIALRLRDSKMVARAFGGRTPDICLQGGDRIERLRGSSGAHAARPDIHVTLWSRDHGYPALVRLARELCGETRRGSLAPRDVTETCVSGRLADPAGCAHPDLVVLWDGLACIPEFPPWQLQNAELVQAAPGTRSVGDALCRALAEYAAVERRWG
ncbi:hypothetical protein LPJ61_006014, partial [Coemansia biformis]